MINDFPFQSFKCFTVAEGVSRWQFTTQAFDMPASIAKHRSGKQQWARNLLEKTAVTKIAHINCQKMLFFFLG